MQEKSELGIPTIISYTLYRYDYFDNLILSVLKKNGECFWENDNTFIISMGDLIDVFRNDDRISKEENDASDKMNGVLKGANSISFIFNIFNYLHNLQFIRFKISKSKKTSRVVKNETGSVLIFNYTIIEAILNIPSLLTENELENFNKFFIKNGILNKYYLNRSNYFEIGLSEFMEILLKEESSSDIDLGFIDKIIKIIPDKIEKDDPMVIILTDYPNY